MCFGVFNDATKKPNVTNYRKRARKDADKKSGKKKPRLMDKDAPLSQIGVYCTFLLIFYLCIEPLNLFLDKKIQKGPFFTWNIRGRRSDFISPKG
jgi:hypothetical protein